MFYHVVYSRLNEGHTKYVERLIVSKLKGGELLRQLLASDGWLALQYAVSRHVVPLPILCGDTISLEEGLS